MFYVVAALRNKSDVTIKGVINSNSKVPQQTLQAWGRSFQVCTVILSCGLLRQLCVTIGKKMLGDGIMGQKVGLAYNFVPPWNVITRCSASSSGTSYRLPVAKKFTLIHATSPNYLQQ
jgi:hypothetical protein